MDKKTEFQESKLFDQKKRNTLKLMAGAGAGLGLAGLPIAGHAAALASDSASATGQAILPPLQIEILAGKAVSGDSVIIRNNTSADIQLNAFAPGIVAFKDSMIDLNTLIQGDKIVIEAHQPLSATVAQWQLLAVQMFKEYVWADESAIELSGDTYVVKLDGVLNGGQVILSPSVPSIYS